VSHQSAKNTSKAVAAEAKPEPLAVAEAGAPDTPQTGIELRLRLRSAVQPGSQFAAVPRPAKFEDFDFNDDTRVAAVLTAAGVAGNYGIFDALQKALCVGSAQSGEDPDVLSGEDSRTARKKAGEALLVYLGKNYARSTETRPWPWGDLTDAVKSLMEDESPIVRRFGYQAHLMAPGDGDQACNAFNYAWSSDRRGGADAAALGEALGAVYMNQPRERLIEAFHNALTAMHERDGCQAVFEAGALVELMPKLGLSQEWSEWLNDHANSWRSIQVFEAGFQGWRPATAAADAIGQSLALDAILLCPKDPENDPKIARKLLVLVHLEGVDSRVKQSAMRAMAHLAASDSSQTTSEPKGLPKVAMKGLANFSNEGKTETMVGVPFGSTEDGALVLAEPDGGPACVVTMPFGPDRWIRLFSDRTKGGTPEMSYLIGSREEIVNSIREDFGGYDIKAGLEIAAALGI